MHSFATPGHSCEVYCAIGNARQQPRMSEGICTLCAAGILGGSFRREPVAEGRSRSHHQTSNMRLPMSLVRRRFPDRTDRRSQSPSSEHSDESDGEYQLDLYYLNQQEFESTFDLERFLQREEKKVKIRETRRRKPKIPPRKKNKSKDQKHRPDRNQVTIPIAHGNHTS